MISALPLADRLAGLEKMPKQVAVAWSGGLDSTALLWLMKEKGFDVHAWHIDHGWHGGSSVVAEQLEAKASLLGIPYHSRRLQKPDKNLESESRKLRYQAFAALADETGCHHLLLGHHADDQAETVCMRLLQGSGISGCAGMRMHRLQQGLHLWRPMLGIERNELEQLLRTLGIDWLDDPSNEDTSIWRNKIRKKLFPLMMRSGVNPRELFLRWQVQAEKTQQQIEFLAKEIKVEKISQDKQDVTRLDWNEWDSQPQPVRVYLLQRMISLLFSEGVVMGRRHILAIEAWRKQGARNWLNLSGCCLYREGEDLKLCQGKLSLRQNIFKKDVKERGIE